MHETLSELIRRSGTPRTCLKVAAAWIDIREANRVVVDWPITTAQDTRDFADTSDNISGLFDGSSTGSSNYGARATCSLELAILVKQPPTRGSSPWSRGQIDPNATPSLGRMFECVVRHQ
jgi:hypothetical protein